jgi:hypothetical protein
MSAPVGHNPADRVRDADECQRSAAPPPAPGNLYGPRRQLDPGPLDGVADAHLQTALQTYLARFAQDDIMAMGRDPQSAEVEAAAFRALLYRCWREDKLPPTDPLRHTPPPPPL